MLPAVRHFEITKFKFGTYCIAPFHRYIVCGISFMSVLFQKVLNQNVDGIRGRPAYRDRLLLSLIFFSSNLFIISYTYLLTVTSRLVDGAVVTYVLHEQVHIDTRSNSVRLGAMRHNSFTRISYQSQIGPKLCSLLFEYELYPVVDVL